VGFTWFAQGESGVTGFLFQWLAQNPYRGRHRPEIKENYYSYPEGAHLIFYWIRKKGIGIIGIPHQRMDYNRYFSDIYAL
jgi:toxin ParE1/3/4